MNCRILSIDAWRNDCGWGWNNWYQVGELSLEALESLKTNRQLLKYLREEAGVLSDESKGMVSVEDDQYNIVIRKRSNDMPLFAIEYGNHY